MKPTQSVVFRHHRIGLHLLDTPALSFTRCFRLNGSVPPVTLCFRANVDGSLVEVFFAFRLAVKALPPLTDIALKERGGEETCEGKVVQSDSTHVEWQASLARCGKLTQQAPTGPPINSEPNPPQNHHSLKHTRHTTA